jgi:hypothetical protein
VCHSLATKSANGVRDSVDYATVVASLAVKFNKSQWFDRIMKIDKSQNDEFYVLSQFLWAGSHKEDLRFVVYTNNWKSEVLYKVRYGIPLDHDEQTGLTATAGRTHRLEDFPWTNSDVMIVSDRVRAVIQSFSETDCVFYPMRIYWQSTNIPDKYWLMQVANVIDCVDVDHSDTATSEYGIHFFYRIDPGLVPEGAFIFRPNKTTSMCVVRHEVRMALDKIRTTGCFFRTAGR